MSLVSTAKASIASKPGMGNRVGTVWVETLLVGRRAAIRDFLEIFIGDIPFFRIYT